jgi:hypothetical protein
MTRQARARAGSRTVVGRAVHDPGTDGVAHRG